MKRRIPPVVLVLGAAALMAALRRLSPWPERTIPGSGVLAALLAAVGITVALLGVRSFRRARTTVDPLAPQRATTLVVGGVYRVSRNPMYLGFALLLAAWGVWLSSAAALLVVPGFVWAMGRYQIRPEERALESLFGQEYLRYTQRVRRWL